VCCAPIALLFHASALLEWQCILAITEMAVCGSGGGLEGVRSAEEELARRISIVQPELAPRLARRILLSGTTSDRLDVLLSSEAALAHAIQEALAEEFREQVSDGHGGGGRQQCGELPTSAGGDARATFAGGEKNNRRTGSTVQLAGSGLIDDSQDNAMMLWQRVRALQPEIAPRIVDALLALGPAVVCECLGSDWALQRRVDEALQALFATEAYAPPPSLLRPPTSGLVSGIVSRGRVRGGPGQMCLGQSHWPLHGGSDGSSPPRPPSLEWPATSLPTALAVSSTERACDGGCGGSAGSRVWGLEDLLAELSLSEYLQPAVDWTRAMGAAFLEEVMENQEDFAETLNLRPLGLRRLQRQGPETVARLARLRPRERRTAVPLSTPSAPDPLSVPVPTVLGVSSRSGDKVGWLG